ncbi:phosphatidylserine/phosphatidylglycerophosphate/cardiolipin synthase-like enzyme [Undibacterium sp. GrIS 1.2]|uniref:phospholipase D-like domain-containing protein n=1 Tax=Undibacterium sp. GrIS 1.2 TaxID=3143933 RepID=UPI00339B24A5
MVTTSYQSVGTNAKAEFTLKLHRGEGMILLGMNWKSGKPPVNFVGFAIEYQPPSAKAFKPLNNRLSFPTPGGAIGPQVQSSLVAPIQKFRWVHFPSEAQTAGAFNYRVTPLFMDAEENLSQGELQQANIELGKDTYQGELNVSFTRGFVSSQAFIDHYQQDGHTISEILPDNPDNGLDFKPTHPDAVEALSRLGFESRQSILEVLDTALATPTATVKAIAYDLNLPEVLERFERLGNRLTIIVDDSGQHGSATSCESQATARLVKSAGANQVKRQHMSGLQHNKVLIVESGTYKAVVCGSTNFSWRGLYVQANNTLVILQPSAVAVFSAAFDLYWNSASGAAFKKEPATAWTDLQLPSVNAKVTFSPHSTGSAVLQPVADDIDTATSSVLFALAFLYQTTGPLPNSIQTLERSQNIFVYGMSDRDDKKIDLANADGHFVLTEPEFLGANVPAPFRSESDGGSGVRLHNKFVIVDFDKPKLARVYTGSFNFSNPADTSNGENLLIIRDPRVATAYMVEAVSLFDHYEFRKATKKASDNAKPLQLQKPPVDITIKPWWDRYWSEALRQRDRELFS